MKFNASWYCLISINAALTKQNCSPDHQPKGTEYHGRLVTGNRCEEAPLSRAKCPTFQSTEGEGSLQIMHTNNQLLPARKDLPA